MKKRMKCRDFIGFIAEYLEGTLPEAQRAEFEGHMDECPYCVNYLESYKATIKLAAAIHTDPDAPVPEDVPEDLVRAILEARKKKAGE